MDEFLRVRRLTAPANKRANTRSWRPKLTKEKPPGAKRFQKPKAPAKEPWTGDSKSKNDKKATPAAKPRGTQGKKATVRAATAPTT